MIDLLAKIQVRIDYYDYDNQFTVSPTSQEEIDRHKRIGCPLVLADITVGQFNCWNSDISDEDIQSEIAEYWPD